MENINDTLLVTINLSASSLDESTVEVVTYLGQHRDVINIFRGEDAELIYKTLINRYLIKEHLAKLPLMSNPSSMMNEQTLEDLLSDVNTDDRSEETTPQLDPIMFATEEEATKVLDQMRKTLGIFGIVTFDDYKKMVGLTNELDQDFNYGWTNLDEAKVIMESAWDYSIIFPPAVLLNNFNWKYANPAIGKVTRKEVNGETIYVLDKFPQEDNNDRNFEEPEVETGTAM